MSNFEQSAKFVKINKNGKISGHGNSLDMQTPIDVLFAVRHATSGIQSVYNIPDFVNGNEQLAGKPAHQLSTIISTQFTNRNSIQRL
jgi:hypothetical protein